LFILIFAIVHLFDVLNDLVRSFEGEGEHTKKRDKHDKHDKAKTAQMVYQ